MSLIKVQATELQQVLNTLEINNKTMAKASGGTRKLKYGSREYRKRQDEIKAMQGNGKYSSVTMGTHGGYLAIEKSNSQHKIEEIEAGKILADNGYKVILTSEDGHKATGDGTLFSIGYEQRTPTKGTAHGVLKAIEHARIKVMKGAKEVKIPVIYDKKRLYNKTMIEEGIKLYERINKISLCLQMDMFIGINTTIRQR